MKFYTYDGKLACEVNDSLHFATERLGEGPTTPRETPDTPVSDVSLPPERVVGPPLTVGRAIPMPSLEKRYISLDGWAIDSVASRPSRSLAGEPEKQGRDRTLRRSGSVPVSGKGGHRARLVLTWYAFALAFSFTIARLAGMDGWQTGLFMVIGMCGAVGWVRGRLAR